MESPNPIDSVTKNPAKETFTTNSPPKSTAPSELDPTTSTKQSPPPTTSIPRSSGGSKTTTMSSPATEDPSVTSNPEPTTKDPVSTETEPATTTTEQPETTTTTDVITTTAPTSTSDAPATTRTSSDVVTITSMTTTPYTTRYITTVSIITIKTVVPQPTMISGSATTIFIPLTTTIETPTVIRDPNQPPPGGVSNANDKKPMPPWQVMLIVAACLIVAAAGCAVLLVGRIKKRRRERDAQQHFKFPEQQHPHQKEVMFGIGRGDESVIESSVTDASGAMSNRTLISPAEGAGRVYDNGNAHAGGLRGWMERFRSWTAWDTQRAYHGPAHSPGGGNGPVGRLWLMEEDAELGTNDHTFADMRPVSYQNENYAGGVASAQPLQYQQPHQHDQDFSIQGQHGSPRQAAYPLPPLSQSSRMSSASATTAHSNHNINDHAAAGASTNASSSPSLLHPLLEERVSMGSDGGDGRGTVVQDRGVLASNNRTSMYVDPAMLELHGMCEHIRKAPQALPGSGSPSNRVADAGKGQERQAEQLKRADEEGQASEMSSENDGEASDTVVEPHAALKHTASLETRRNSSRQAQAAAPTVDHPPVNIAIERGTHGNSVHESEPDDVFYMCPESPIGTIAPDDSQNK